MRKLFYFGLFLLCCFSSAFAQTGKLSGVVLDKETKLPLELSTVSIFKNDSILVKYQFSDNNGRFAFDKLPLKESLAVSITYTGYNAYKVSVLLQEGKTDTLSVYLTLKNNDSNAVIVTSVIPVNMNGDTLEINPAAFKMKAEAVVEEMLSQVSGITIWSDGSITVNGRRVQSLLVDGKPFMGFTDSRVATQNLPKSAVEKIQVYQQFDRSMIGKEATPQDSLLTMNIKLKENSKTGYFGKMGGGYGTQNRFESDLSFMAYNKKSSLGVGAGINNINKGIGNLQEMFQNNTFRNYNPNLYNVGRFDRAGINKNHSIGGVFTHNFIESLNDFQNNRIALNYTKSGEDAFITETGLQNRTTVDNPQIIRENNQENNSSDRHDAGVFYIKANSYSDYLSVNGNLSKSQEKMNSSGITEVLDTLMQLQSSTIASALQNKRSDNATFNSTFARYDRENPLKDFRLSINSVYRKTATERDVQTLFYSPITNQRIYYNRNYKSDDNTFSINGELDYSGFKRFLLGRYNLFGISLGFVQNLNYSRITNADLVSDYDTATKQYLVNTNLSYSNRRDILRYTPLLKLGKSFNKSSQLGSKSMNVQMRLSEEFTLDKNNSSILKRNLNRSFQFFRYDANVLFSVQKNMKYRYRASINVLNDFEYPSIDQLYNIVDDINVYDVRVGNPNLKNQVNHTITGNINYSTLKQRSPYVVELEISGDYNRSSNPVTDSIINDISGKRISYYINAGKGESRDLGYKLNVSRDLGESNLELSYNGRLNTELFSNYIDSRYNRGKTNSVFGDLSMQFSFRSIFTIDVAYMVQQYKTQQTAVGLSSFSNTNKIAKMGLSVNLPSSITMSSTVENIKNSNLDKPVFLWNAFTSYRFMKQQAELKLSAMDILKKYNNIINSVNPYGTSVSVTNGLRQYFLVTFSYYPRKFGKKEVKNPMN